MDALTTETVTLHALYALAWITFGAGHSFLAGQTGTQGLRNLLGAWYRFSYNTLAIIHIAAVAAFGWWLFDGGAPFDRPGWLIPMMTGAVFVGIAVFLAGLANYDGKRLLGFLQIGAGKTGQPAQDDEPLNFNGINRYIRHPLYAGGFLILWGRATDEFGLATAVWGSLYLLIGARMEERRLIRMFGGEYVDYRRRVPAYIPWRGRAV
ncbi:MAG: isoprenylcysteine carboxylmethyltransferase family protein [Rhodospirillales bacterium]|nr:isoprenylcysteine carboxylmethyltransferase family protein [Rhodospirillales bacterium]